MRGMGWVLMVACLASVACLGGTDRPERDAGSALWLGSGPSPEPASLRRLAELGVADLFLPAGRLGVTGGEAAIEVLELPDLPRRSTVTAVVTGRWPGLAGQEEAFTQSLQREVQRFVIRLQGPGITLKGLHFELQADVEDLAAYALALETLSRQLPESLLLSVGLHRDWLALEATLELAKQADFVVGWAYGRRPEVDRGGEADRLWDLQAVDTGLVELEQLGVDYLVGVATVGAAWKLSRGGEEESFSHQGELSELALSRKFRLGSSFVLTGLDTRRYEFQALAEARFGDWKLAKGESVRVEGLTGSHLREYRRRLLSRDLTHYLGDLYFRSPSPGERFSLPLGALIAGIEGEPVAAGLEAEIEVLSRSSRRWVLRLKLRNPGQQATEVGFTESNFLELKAHRGTFRQVEPGDFYRYRLLEPTADGLRASLRNASVLQLFRPILAAGEEVSTGRIELRPSQGKTSIDLRGGFLLSDGTPMPVAPSSWPQ